MKDSKYLSKHNLNRENFNKILKKIKDKKIFSLDTKEKSLEYFKKGKFGNMLRTWFSYEDYINSSYKKSVTIRYKQANTKKFCKYEVENVDKQIDEFVKKGARRDLFYFNESAPDDNLRIQGEIMINKEGYCFFYSTEKGKMRDCLRNSGKHAFGLEAKFLLENNLYSNSLDDLKTLLKEYPGHIVEFSTYKMSLGDCKNRNTIFWEVRNY